MARKRRPRIAVWKFASCDGCQLAVFNCEDELLALGEAVAFVNFREATSTSIAGPYDISFVEGSVTTLEDARRIQDVRAESRVLVTLGACATSGGIQALRNFANVEEFRQIVYARPEYIATLSTSTSIQDHVPVDFELRGCPISRAQLLEVITAFLDDRIPQVPTESVCAECKRRGNVCVMVAQGTPCLGPVTQAGCGALCPAYDRGCYGCFGPQDSPNATSLMHRLARLGMDAGTQLRMFRSFHAANPVFRAASEAAVREGARP